MRSQVALLALLTVHGCAALPTDPVERALYQDLRVVVETAETTHWVVDRLEVSDAAESALRSTCQVAIDHQRALYQWLEAEIAARGGPAEAQWAIRGGEFDGFDELMTIERVQTVLAYAMDRDAADCPFWLPKSEEFRGVHQSVGRFVLLGESNGGGSLVIASDGEVGVGGGGAGRLIPAFGITDQLTLGFGAEFGATGAFADVDGSQQLDARFMLATPLVLRIQDASTLIDVEVASVTLFTQTGFPDPPGFRVAVGWGFAAPRVADFMPVALGWIGYEFYPGRSGEPDSHAMRLGTRIGVDWDP